jgi:hypothetical protein
MLYADSRLEFQVTQFAFSRSNLPNVHSVGFNKRDTSFKAI